MVFPVVLVGRMDEVPVSGVDSSEGVASGVGGLVGGVEGGVVGGLVDHGLSFSLSLCVEVPVSEVVVRRLVVTPGVSGVDSGVTVGVEGGVEESLASEGVEEHLGLSFSLTLSLSLGNMDSGDSVVGLNGDGGGESSWLVGGVAGVAGHGSGVAIGDVVSLLVAEGVVELGVGLSLSSSQSSATDLSMRSEYGENY